MTSLDVTKGACFWDGADITTNSHYLNWELKFSNPGHNLWNLKETSGTNQLITTRAIDKTTFSKFQNQGKKWSRTGRPSQRRENGGFTKTTETRTYVIFNNT